jgi:hypothetical protein
MFYHPTPTRHSVEMRPLTKRKLWEVRNSAEDKATDSRESQLLRVLLKYPATKVDQIKDANQRRNVI